MATPLRGVCILAWLQTAEPSTSECPVETWWQDLRHGLRVLTSQPAFTAVAVASLALGIGANTAIFSVTNALLLRPLPYEDADRIAILWQRSPGLNVAQDWFSIGQYVDIRTDNHVFSDVAATIGASFNLTGRGLPERIDGARVSSSLFTLFGAKAASGRLFSADEDVPGKPPVVIPVSYTHLRAHETPEHLVCRLLLE